MPLTFERASSWQSAPTSPQREDEDRLAAQEVVPRLAERPADLRRRAGLVQLLQELQRLHMAGAVDQRLHVFRIEPVDVLRPRDLVAGVDHERGRERLEVIVALLADLQVQHRAAVGLGVGRIPVLAVEVFRDVEQLLPGLRRVRQIVAVFRLERRLVLGIGQHVVAVVENLAVAVVEHAVADAFPLMQRLQRGRHVVVGPLRILARGLQLVDRDRHSRPARCRRTRRRRP